MNLPDRYALTKHLRAAVEQAGGLATVAALWDVSYSTASKMLTPTDDSHVLGLFETVDLLDASPDALPLLQWLANRYGLVVVRPPSPNAPGEALLQEVAEISRDEGQLAGTALECAQHATQGLSDDEVTRLRERAASVQREAEQLVMTAAAMTKRRHRAG